MVEVLGGKDLFSEPGKSKAYLKYSCEIGGDRKNNKSGQPFCVEIQSGIVALLPGFVLFLSP